MEILNTILLIVTLSFFEITLSLDNAVALTSITEGLDSKDRKIALNIGMILSYVFRIGLLFCATWIIRYWQLKLVAAAYLFYLVFTYFLNLSSDEELKPKNSLMSAISAVVFTDLAFSLDSISAAVAISDRFVVIIIGCGIGVFALRFLADLFQVWMEKFVHLELSGYLAIALVAAKLLAEIIYPVLVVPELIEVAMIFLIFAFGFSKQYESESLVNS
jgi:YkoY family integral membrane protein